MILPDWPSRAKIQARLHVDQFTQAIEASDFLAVYDACRQMRATADWVAHEVLPLVVTDSDAEKFAELKRQLFFIRQQRQHLAGSPRDCAELARVESMLVAELQEVTCG